VSNVVVCHVVFVGVGAGIADSACGISVGDWRPCRGASVGITSTTREASSAMFGAMEADGALERVSRGDFSGSTKRSFGRVSLY